MRKKIYLFIIFVLLFQFFSVTFLSVEAKNDEQPKTCAGPSEMMSLYFDFQKEMKLVLLGTQLNIERFSASFSSGGLFTNRVLEFNSTSAIELLSSRVIGNIRSFVSNSMTSLILLELAAFSVAQSNTEGLAILFADWPIVRDYKTMLDIETDLFDIAYFRSKEIDLTQSIDSNMEAELKKVIKKYIDKGLLTGHDNAIHGSMSDVLWDLNSMNVVMKQFIMVGGKSVGNAGLRKYRGCLGNVERNEKDGIGKCTDKIAIIMFSGGAIDQLYDDYKGVRGPFGGCNLYGNSFGSAIKKMIKNNLDPVSDAVNDVKDALSRLWNDALWNKKRWDFHDPCKDLSAYEMSKLQAYWGGTWECGYGINLFTTKTYLKEKYANSRQEEKPSDILRNSANKAGSEKSNKKMQNAKTYQERAEYYASQMGGWDLSPYYNYELNTDLLMSMDTTMEEFFQSQGTAAAADVITLFGGIKGVLDEIDEVIKKAKALKKQVKGIESKQCN